MIFTSLRRVALAGVLVMFLGLLGTAVAVGASTAGQPQRKQLAIATLSRFRVIIRATRGSGSPPMATVTAAGFRRSGGHWKFIATRRIGKANGWFWFSVDTCSLTTTQLQNISRPPGLKAADSIKVKLLITPAIGCSVTFTERWRA